MAWGTQPGRGRRKAARPVISKAPNKKGARKGGHCCPDTLTRAENTALFHALRLEKQYEICYTIF